MDDFWTLQQIQAEDSATDYSSEEEDASVPVLEKLLSVLSTSDADSTSDGAAAAVKAPLQAQTYPESRLKALLGAESRASTRDDDIASLKATLKPAGIESKGALLGDDSSASIAHDDHFGFMSRKNGVANHQTFEKGTAKRHVVAHSESSDEDDGIDHEPDDFFDANLDEDDRRAVNREFRVGQNRSDALVSCPGCFATVAYDTKQHASESTWYVAERTFHCKVENGLAFCKECSCRLGIMREEDGKTEFRRVLPSAI